MCFNRKILLNFATFMNQTALIYYIRISDMFESKNLTHFCNIFKSVCFDIYQNFRYVWINKFYLFWAHLQIRLFRYIISEFLICLNQKILLTFATFMNQTVLSEFQICLNRKIRLIFATFANQIVLLYYIRTSDMFESKNSTCCGHIYKSDHSDILYQNFSCKTHGISKKIRIKENLTTVIESWVYGRDGSGWLFWGLDRPEPLAQ